MIASARLQSAVPDLGAGYELSAIAAVVLGGTSLMGGRGSLVGTLVGAAIIGVLINGMTLLDVSSFYQQIIQVFEQSKRSVPVFNDKHFSTSWNEAKWMFDKSRELNFPLYGGSSIPFYYRKPEIEIDVDTPIKHSVVAGAAGDEGGAGGHQRDGAWGRLPDHRRGPERASLAC